MQQVKMVTPSGAKVYSAYADNREMAEDFRTGALHLGDEVIYRGQICEVLYEFTDVDGVKYMELLVKGGTGGFQFQMM